MEKLKITGNGPLKGDITVSGAKNAALPILCASLLTADTLRLTNVPQLRDVMTTQKLLQGMGARVMTDNVHELELSAAQVSDTCAPYELVTFALSGMGMALWFLAAYLICRPWHPFSCICMSKWGGCGAGSCSRAPWPWT